MQNGNDEISGIYSYTFLISVDNNKWTTVETIKSSDKSCQYEYTELELGQKYYLKVIVTDRAGKSEEGIDEITTVTQYLENVTASKYRGNNGKIYDIAIKGSNAGTVWGSDIYTDDSNIAKAAVHAGLVEIGETKIVQIRILEGQNSYVGDTKNGITTKAYTRFGGSFSFYIGYSTVITAKEKEHEENIGEIYEVAIEGSNAGDCWGDNIYTSYSNIAKAAVHDGLVTIGESKKVKIQIMEGQEKYEGSTKNGISSKSYGKYSYSFMFFSNFLTSTNAVEYRGQNGKFYYIKITGSNSGSVYGEGIYTDDSNIAKAAVHAGIVKIGESKIVKIKIEPGQSSYVGSTKNGITSRSYGSWQGSFTFAD